MDSCVEGVCIDASLVGEMMGFEVAPDGFDVIEFGGVFREPFDGEPMGAGGKRGKRCLAGVDRAVIEHDDNGFGLHARPWAVEPVESVQMGNKICAALGGVHPCGWTMIRLPFCPSSGCVDPRTAAG